MSLIQIVWVEEIFRLFKLNYSVSGCGLIEENAAALLSLSASSNPQFDIFWKVETHFNNSYLFVDGLTCWLLSFDMQTADCEI